MENENTYRQELMNKYRIIFKDLFRYIPWFEQKIGEKAFKLLIYRTVLNPYL